MSFHISADGVARRCSAKAGMCPLGQSEDEHGASAQEAQLKHEQALAAKYGSSFASATDVGAKSGAGESFSVPPTRTIEGYLGDGWAGGNHKPGRSNAEVAKLIRGDIKRAVKAGAIPKDVKVSVSSSLNAIEVKVFPAPGEDTLDYERYRYSHNRYVDPMRDKYSKVRDTLEQIHDSYNYDRSRSEVDYFDRGYYGRVQVLTASEAARQTRYKAQERMKRVVKELDGMSEVERNLALHAPNSKLDKAYKQYHEAKWQERHADARYRACYEARARFQHALDNGGARADDPKYYPDFSDADDYKLRMEKRSASMESTNMAPKIYDQIKAGGRAGLTRFFDSYDVS